MFTTCRFRCDGQKSRQEIGLLESDSHSFASGIIWGFILLVFTSHGPVHLETTIVLEVMAPVVRVDVARYLTQNLDVVGGYRKGSQGAAQRAHPNFWINENEYVFNQNTIKVWFSCSWWCPGTCLCSCRGNIGGKAPHQLKKPFKGQRPRQEGYWEERRRMVFPWKRITFFLILPI